MNTLHPCPGCRCGTGDESAAIACQCAQKLAALRSAAGETQRQLATRLRMTESMISRLERGDHVPSLKTLSRVAQAYGRRLDIVFHEDEHEPADGTHHTHPHDYADPDQQYVHPAGE
ncbi:MAG: helix-turn-helix transcriptional regulator [Stellaceae bacterium]